jgi:hypothetical protein
VRLIDPENFKTTVYVNETEIYSVKVGTPATVKISALPKNTYTAKVDGISETATVSSNVVNYKVTVKLDPVSAETGKQIGSRTNTTAASVPAQGQPPTGQSAPSGQAGMPQAQQSASASTTAATSTNTRLKEGLTVTVSIIVDAKNNILLVPNKAITSSGGRYYAQVVSSAGTVESRVIQVGITDGTNTEVTSGLNENEQVSMVTVTSTSTSSSKKTDSQKSSQSMQMMMDVGGGGSMGGPPSGGGGPPTR